MWDPNQQWIERLNYDGVYVNNEHHSSSALRAEVADLALKGVEGRVYHEAMLHIHLPKRNYRIVEENGARWLVFRNAKWIDKKIEALGYQASTENTLERELVAIIKGMNDDIFPEHDAVKTFRDMVVRIAAHPNMRNGIERLRWRAREVEQRLQLVDEKRLRKQLRDISPAWLQSAEQRSCELFWDFMKITGWTEEELGAIHWLSWAWKLPETYGKLKHMAWCWVLITTVFSLIE